MDRIKAPSPAIDTGSPSYKTLKAPAIDFWGEPRDDGLVDMGADERHP